MTVPLLYVYGDDDLLAERMIDRFATKLAEEFGSPLERWDLLAHVNTSTEEAARLHERLATPVMFGGGTLAVVAKPGNLVKKNVDRDTVLEAIRALAPGNALVLVDAIRTASQPKPSSSRLTNAVKAAEGAIVPAMAPRMEKLQGFIEGEARGRGLELAHGAAHELAQRLGSRVTEGDVERRHLTRIASMELDKLALRHASKGGSITVDDVRELVAVTIPGSLWALADAVGTRDRDAAIGALDRLLDVTPEPVLLVVLHRRIVELLELGDRLAGGEDLAAAARAMGVNSEFRARMLAEQARRWSTDQLAAALHGLVKIDAAVKRVRGYEADEAQGRLHFMVWIEEHVTPRAGPARRVGPG